MKKLNAYINDIVNCINEGGSIGETLEQIENEVKDSPTDYFYEIINIMKNKGRYLKYPNLPACFKACKLCTRTSFESVKIVNIGGAYYLIEDDGIERLKKFAIIPSFIERKNGKIIFQDNKGNEIKPLRTVATEAVTDYNNNKKPLTLDDLLDIIADLGRDKYLYLSRKAEKQNA